MSIDLSSLRSAQRVLFNVPLRPVQGARFQPTGFPDLGAATYQAGDTPCLLVESAQSMANRLETVCWDGAAQDLVPALKGLSYIRVEQGGHYLTSSVTEAHRINSPYILESSDRSFFGNLKAKVDPLADGPVNRKLLAETLLHFDAGSLLHGVFLAKKDLAGGRLRVARALSAFIEATDVQVAASGGVKNDGVNPSGDTSKGFGNIPFHREEYTAKSITACFNLDLSQIRGYGLGEKVERLLVLLSLYKIRALLDGNLRLRTACDLAVASETVDAAAPKGFVLPPLTELAAELPKAVRDCADKMAGVTTVTYKPEASKGKRSTEKEHGAANAAGDSEQAEE